MDRKYTFTLNEEQRKGICLLLNFQFSVYDEVFFTLTYRL